MASEKETQFPSSEWKLERFSVGISGLGPNCSEEGELPESWKEIKNEIDDKWETTKNIEVVQSVLELGNDIKEEEKLVNENPQYLISKSIEQVWDTITGIKKEIDDKWETTKNIAIVQSVLELGNDIKEEEKLVNENPQYLISKSIEQVWNTITGIKKEMKREEKRKEERIRILNEQHESQSIVFYIEFLAKEVKEKDRIDEFFEKNVGLLYEQISNLMTLQQNCKLKIN